MAFDEQLTISVVCDRLLLCRKPGDILEPEYVVDKAARDSKDGDYKETIDVMYSSKTKNSRLGLELKQIGVQYLYNLKNQPWKIWKEKSEAISTMTNDEVLNLPFNKNTMQEKVFTDTKMISYTFQGLFNYPGQDSSIHNWRLHECCGGGSEKQVYEKTPSF